MSLFSQTVVPLALLLSALLPWPLPLLLLSPLALLLPALLPSALALAVGTVPIFYRTLALSALVPLVLLPSALMLVPPLALPY
jgi:hypothetical protein